MPKITIPISAILEVFPGAKNICNLPRKKKKAAKKELSLMVVNLIFEDYTNNHFKETGEIFDKLLSDTKE